ncbi:MAG: alpha/beta fold hydrolase [Candidatus Omnitrophica bacterium]|nr:alpha/beta fold hydrolase [Candidatus Omnitrophota bacterium]
MRIIRVVGIVFLVSVFYSSALCQERFVEATYDLYSKGQLIGRDVAQFHYHQDGFLEEVSGVSTISTSGITVIVNHYAALAEGARLIEYRTELRAAGQKQIVTAHPQGNDMLVSVAGSSKVLKGQADAVLMDNNLAAHFQILVEWLKSGYGDSRSGFMIGPIFQGALSIEAFPMPPRECTIEKSIETDFWLVRIGSNVAQIWVDSDGRFLRVRNPRGGYEFRLTDLSCPPDAIPLPDYIDMSTFQEIPGNLQVRNETLSGLFCIPNGEGLFPGIVLVHGSGANDRDETIGPNKPFRDLAHGLATREIASFRYDKRSYAIPDSVSPTEWDLNVETIDDAVAALDLLRTQAKVDSTQVFVLGHSLGGFAVPYIAEKDGLVTGFISLAGNTRSLDQLTLEQYYYLGALDGLSADEVERESASTFADLERIRSGNFSDDEKLHNAYGFYWRDLMTRDPASKAVTLPFPALILQGERDYQVTMEDFDGWIKAYENAKRTDYTAISYPELNHLFLKGCGEPNPGEYMLEGYVDERVIRDIAEWISSLTPVLNWSIY